MADNHKVEGIEGYVALLVRGVIRHAVHWLWAGRAGGTEAWSVYVVPLQYGLGMMVLGGGGYFALTWAVAAGLAAAVGLLGLVLTVTSVLVGAAVADVVPSPKRVTPVDPALDPATADEGLVALAEGLWVSSAPLTFHGAPFGARMAVIDTGEGLVIYSPVEATTARLDAVRALGEVRWLVAPNPLHHLFLDGWQAAFPAATTVAAPGLAARQPDRRVDLELLQAAEAPWPDAQVATEVVHGHPFHVEIVLLHRSSGTLLVADLIENLGQADDGRWSAWQRMWLWISAMARRPGPPTDWKLTVTDPAALARSVEVVAGWSPTVIVPAHGPPIREHASEVWSQAFGFVRPDPSPGGW